jgi:hypothetical protein
MDKVKTIKLPHGQYLGGNSALGRKRKGNLVLDGKSIGIGVLKPKHATLHWSDIASVQVNGELVGKSKAGAVATFGVLGLAAKGSKNQTTVTVYTKDNQAAYYVIDKMNSVAFIARISPLLRSVGVPLQNEGAQGNSAVPQAQSDDMADQLTKLAKLKEQGILTEAEFTAKKKQLLGL